MIGYKTYQVIDNVPYVATNSIVAAKVLVVDRNGIGVKHNIAFNANPTNLAVKQYNWYGVKKKTLAANSGIFVLINFGNVLTGRYTLFQIGSVVTPGNTYIFWYGQTYIKYTAQTGDTATTVRNAIKSGIDGASWGYTITTNSISTDQLSITTSQETFQFSYRVGSQLWQRGYYLTFNNQEYFIYQANSTTANPTLPAVSASYAFSSLVIADPNVYTYLNDPLSISFFTTASAGTTNITGISTSGNVPANECVVNESEQRIYFDANLNIGEIIKVIYR